MITTSIFDNPAPKGTRVPKDIQTRLFYENGGVDIKSGDYTYVCRWRFHRTKPRLCLGVQDLNFVVVNQILVWKDSATSPAEDPIFTGYLDGDMTKEKVETYVRKELRL